MNTKKIIWTAIGFFGAALVLVVVYIKLSEIELSKAGAAGDAFNGLLAPFIAFGGAILVFLSFREQLEANRLLSRQWLFDVHLKMFDDINNAFNKIAVYDKVNLIAGIRQKVEGVEALDAISNRPWQDFDDVIRALGDFHAVMYEFEFLVDRIEKLDANTKEYMEHKVTLFYSMKLMGFATKLRTLCLNSKEKDSYQAFITCVNSVDGKMWRFIVKPRKD